ncbi:MAG: hypothetical protein QJR02_15155 [Sinobacteraceae bacterium]|nr:hypothetical protein [Nevskiaceae bacterium]MDI3261023.1 hypothetical protein [Nevskiaceae bacterium]
MTRASAWLIAVLALAVGAAHGANEDRARGEAELAKRLAGYQAGKPRDCVLLSELHGTQIIDGTAILYRGNGDTLYLNRPSGAEILRRDVVMVDYPHGSQLCRMDIVELYDSGTRMPRGSISLGSFVPYVKVKPGQGTRTP